MYIFGDFVRWVCVLWFWRCIAAFYCSTMRLLGTCCRFCECGKSKRDTLNEDANNNLMKNNFSEFSYVLWLSRDFFGISFFPPTNMSNWAFSSAEAFCVCIFFFVWHWRHETSVKRRNEETMRIMRIYSLLLVFFFFFRSLLFRLSLPITVIREKERERESKRDTNKK